MLLKNVFKKKRVFKFFLKVVVSLRQHISTGRAFHSQGATAPRDQSPYYPFVHGMARSSSRPKPAGWTPQPEELLCFT
jgi:hypothetical protein